MARPVAQNEIAGDGTACNDASSAKGPRLLDTQTLVIDLGIGLVAGVVGGLAGIGGSIVMLPGLALFHGYRTENDDEHHIYMAASMLVNIVVALSASLKHRQKKAVRPGIMAWLATSMSFGALSGVLASGLVKGTVNKWVFATFIWAYCLYTIVTLVRRLPERPDDAPTPKPIVLATIGLFTGFAAGFLGVGGGILLVPLLQVAGLPLRQAIAGSAAVMWISAAVGATSKLIKIHFNADLEALGLTPMDAIAIAGPMGAGALAGGFLGAWLSHTLKIPALKVAIVVVLSLAALKMVV